MFNLNLTSILIFIGALIIVLTYAYVKWQNHTIDNLHTEVVNSKVVEKALKKSNTAYTFEEKQRAIFQETKNNLKDIHDKNITNIADGNYTYQFK